jgi:hypothetical protein
LTGWELVMLLIALQTRGGGLHKTTPSFKQHDASKDNHAELRTAIAVWKIFDSYQHQNR